MMYSLPHMAYFFQIQDRVLSSIHVDMDIFKSKGLCNVMNKPGSSLSVHVMSFMTYIKSRSLLRLLVMMETHPKRQKETDSFMEASKLSSSSNHPQVESSSTFRF